MKKADTFLRKTFNQSPFSLAVLIIFILVPVSSFAADYPFTGPTNWGATGLMEMPTARVLEYGKYRFGFSQIEPYRYYYGTVSPWPGIEINGRITEAMDTEAQPYNPQWEGYGNYKDKAFDLKYQLLPEGKYWPALALGIMDPHGTRIYSGQYLVASKQIYPFDFTIGFGNGRFGKKQLPEEEFGMEIFSDFGQWCSDGRVFGGIEFAPSKYFSLIVEYNPIQYEEQTNDPAQIHFQEEVPSKINYGLRLKPADWAQLDVSYQRGNQLGFNLSFSFNIEKPLLPIYDILYVEHADYKNDPLARRVSRGLYESGFRDIGVRTGDSEIWIQAANERYYYNTRAIGIILNVLDQLLPASIERIYVILVERGIPVISFGTARQDIHDFESGVFKPQEFVSLSEMKTDIYEVPEMSLNHKKYFSYGIKPELYLYFNDPSGFLKTRAGVSGWLALHPWKGASFVVGAEGYPVNDIFTVNEPLSIPVRSDNVAYLDNKASLSNLMFEQIGKTKYEIHAKLAAGLLETEYAGLDAEIALPLLNGRILAGVSGSLVRKRDTANPFKLSDEYEDNYDTQFFNARLNLPEVEMAIDVKAGKFLAGDKGARVTISKFFNGVVLSAWYSFTDTSDFSDEYNNDYHDKGIAISIPLRMFLGRDSRTVYDYSISPWTRDVAQDIKHRTSLFDFIGRNTGKHLLKDSQFLKLDYNYANNASWSRYAEQLRIINDSETPVVKPMNNGTAVTNSTASAIRKRLQFIHYPDAE